MDLEEVLKARLKARNDKSGSNQKIADETNLSQSYINQLLNGRRSFYGLSLRNVLQLFPEIQHVLEDYYTKHQGASSISISGNGSAASVNGNATVAPMKDYSHLRKEILEDGEICDRCKIKMLTHLENE